MTEAVQLDNLSGYSDTRDLLATRYKSGSGSTVYVIALPIHLIPSHLPKPDPDEPFEGNRKVDLAHARKFARYWRENKAWTTPPILLDTNAELGFDTKFTAQGVSVGVLALPHNSAGTIDILDGQHRVLGWYVARDELAGELKKTREQLQRSKEVEDELGVATWRAKIADLEAVEKRLKSEYVTMELIAGVSLQKHKQAFADITNNARGITKSKTVEFDSVSVINRVTRLVSDEHRLLSGRIDFEQDRVTGKNPNFLSARNVADIVRHVALGMKGRMNDRREKAYSDQLLERLALAYFDSITEAFSELEDVAIGELAPDELRRTSLLGSPTILRVLAGAFHALAVEVNHDMPAIWVDDSSGTGAEYATDCFQQLDGHMAAPAVKGGMWHRTGFFGEEGGMAPGSRAQDLVGLSNAIIKWFEVQPPEELT